MLTRIPLADAYDVTLSQNLDASTGAGGWIYCTSVPSSALPAGYTTSLRIDPGTSRAEEIEVDLLDPVNKRWRIKTRNLEQGMGIVTVAQAHPNGSKAIISDSYAFWKAVADAINNFQGPISTYADEAARDAAIPSPANGMLCYVSSVGQLMQYVSGNWLTIASGTDFASTRSLAGGSLANNGELYRDSTDSNSLYYKNNSGTSVKLLVEATGKLDSSVYDFATLSDAIAGTDNTKPMTALRTQQQVFTYFGSGVEGDATITGGTTTLTRDMAYNNLTITGTGVLAPNGYRVFVKGSLTIQAGGKISFNGNAGGAGGAGGGSQGAAGTAGAALNNAGSFTGHVAGQAGGLGNTSGLNGAAGGNGTATNPSFSATAGAAGGAGANFSGNGGAGGASGASTRGLLYNRLQTLEDIFAAFSIPAAYGISTAFFPTTQYKAAGGSGGGGGGAGGSAGAQYGGSGGGSGSSGGILSIFANTLNNAGTIEANGGAGGAGGNSPSYGGGGGGGGGSGGVVWLVYRTLTALGTVTANGGAAGAAGTGTANGTAGSSGVSGVIIQKLVS